MKIIKQNQSTKRVLKENYNEDPKRFDKVFEEFYNLRELVNRIYDKVGSAKDEEVTNNYFKSFITDIDAKIYDIEELLK